MNLKHFVLSEFDCKETGENEMDPEFLLRLDALRFACGFPFKVVSGYRSPEHSEESVKATPGQHALGVAADIRVVGGARRRKIVYTALRMGFGGIGVGKDFVHVDTRASTPVIWTY